MEIFYETKKPVVLLTNNFEFTFEDISEIYRLRWAIESLYKQLKQNFPLHFFYGDSVNAIQIQTWVVLIANLLITVLSKKHQEALCILAGCYHGTTYAHVLRRFYRIHGKSRENLE